MSKFGSKEEILKVIEDRFDQMRNTRLSMEDLETLVEHARELYERTLILRYKAYEEKVFGEVREVLEQQAAAVTETHESPVAEEVVEDEEPVIEPEAPVSEEATAEEPVFDFSLFDEEEEKQMPIFEPENSEVSAPAETEPEAEITEEPVMEMDAETELEPEEENAPVLEPETAVEEEEPVAVHETTHEEVTTASGDSNEALFKRIWSQDDSLASRLSLTKLDTLLGSFGFNERFQVVQELFKGSTDDFNQAIDVLDNLAGLPEAEKQLLFYVRLYGWDLESEVAVEFIRKIERRYIS